MSLLVRTTLVSVLVATCAGDVRQKVHGLRALLTGAEHRVVAAVTVPTAPTPVVPLPGSGPMLVPFPPDRVTLWDPGVAGGIPPRPKACSRVQAASCGADGAVDASACIQAALDACPAGQAVELSAGTFRVDGGSLLLIHQGITLRGAGPGKTLLTKTDGARPDSEPVGPHPSPVVILGPSRWSTNGSNTDVTTSVDLKADAPKESRSVQVASSSGLHQGQIVLLDEASGAAWQQDPTGRGKVWAAPDYRVVWQLHDPPQGTDDPLVAGTATGGPAAGWFSRPDRPTAELKQIERVSDDTVTFTTPVHISYRKSHGAQISTYGQEFVRGAGLEDLTVRGGDQGNIRFQWCAGCWAARVESAVWHDEGVAIDASFRTEVREAYIHDAAWAQPGGAGYAVSLSKGSSEALIENSIIVKANKVMVARSAGAGSVFAYDYVDDGYINTNHAWVESGLNASHMVGSHHVLFEGNYGFNWDSDKTHGNAIYHTIFRNQLRGVRRTFGDAVGVGHGPLRCAGAGTYSYWDTFVGNVLGAPGQMAGWTYESNKFVGGRPTIWMLGWDDWPPYPVDPGVVATTLRHGNLDYVTGKVTWDPAIADHQLPPSLYLKHRPAFFDAGHGYRWPWVDPTSAAPLGVLPAKARFDAGTPFLQP